MLQNLVFCCLVAINKIRQHNIQCSILVKSYLSKSESSNWTTDVESGAMTTLNQIDEQHTSSTDIALL